VALGQDIGQKVVMDGIIEVGRHFILYEVKEVGSVPMGGVWITQLVAPLNSHLSVLLHFLLLIFMAFFPCFFQSSAVFGQLDRVSGRDEVQIRFSDSFSMVKVLSKDIIFVMQAFFISLYLVCLPLSSISCCSLSSDLVFILDS
jgi:hypothetical protein